jgi:hypothetical protein
MIWQHPETSLNPNPLQLNLLNPSASVGQNTYFDRKYSFRHCWVNETQLSFSSTKIPEPDSLTSRTPASHSSRESVSVSLVEAFPSALVKNELTPHRQSAHATRDRTSTDPTERAIIKMNKRQQGTKGETGLGRFLSLPKNRQNLNERFKPQTPMNMLACIFDVLFEMTECRGA